MNEVAQVLALDKSIKTDYVKHTINAYCKIDQVSIIRFSTAIVM